MKSGNDSLDELLDRIAGAILTFECGDVMTLSLILDLLEELRAGASPEPLPLLVSEKLVAIAKAEIKGETDGFAEHLSRGIDFVRDLAETDGEIPAWKKQKVEAWIGSLALPEQVSKTAPSVNDGAERALPADNDQLKQFISDCGQRLARAQEVILFLEEDLENAGLINELFRIFHTIKGECGFLKLSMLGTLSHNIENLLDLLRSRQMKADAGVIGRLLEGLDLAKSVVKTLGSGMENACAKEPIDDYIVSLSVFTGSVKPVERKHACNDVAVPTATAGEPALGKQAAVSAGLKEVEAADPLIKVNTSKVNYLVDMIGELLIALAQVDENIPALVPVREISRTLQYAGMQLRTESVHALFGSMKRIIRDTAAKVGKPVHMEFSGSELEIDRTLIESLEEPLMHIVRNALDHGIENATERAEAGKPTEGLVRLSAARRGNNIVISVADDGRGLERKKILSKAVEKGLVHADDAKGMSDSAVFNLIFVSGFSTKSGVDLISGRGVGMDIVKAAMTRAKGRIEIESRPGKGTTFSLFTPLSTAIIDGMTIRVGTNIFIIPVAVIVESLKIKEGMARRLVQGATVIQLRGETIPVIDLANVLKIANAGAGMIVTIVENANKERFAISCDEIIAKREIVIKSLDARFRDLKGISSGTVLSGGTIGLVLDIDEIVALSADDCLHGKKEKRSES